MKTALDPRHLNRQKIVQELFAWAFHKNQPTDLSQKIIKLVAPIDKLVAENAPEFPLDRLNATDLAILRLAVYELVFVHQEPPKVIIDEAIELAKELGGENSPGFINGVLGKILISPARTTKIIADTLGVEEEKITPEADLRRDLNATDLEIADLVAKLEKDLSIAFKSSKKLATVGQILEFIEDHNE